jgi:hypothetical protein
MQFKNLVVSILCSIPLVFGSTVANAAFPTDPITIGGTVHTPVVVTDSAIIKTINDHIEWIRANFFAEKLSNTVAPPEIYIISRVMMNEIFRKGDGTVPGPGVGASYFHDQTTNRRVMLLIEENVNLDDKFLLSLMLHESVHHLQIEIKSNEISCQGDMEAVAYQIQALWLHKVHGVPANNHIVQNILGLMHAHRC